MFNPNQPPMYPQQPMYNPNQPPMYPQQPMYPNTPMYNQNPEGGYGDEFSSFGSKAIRLGKVSKFLIKPIIQFFLYF